MPKEAEACVAVAAAMMLAERAPVSARTSARLSVRSVSAPAAASVFSFARCMVMPPVSRASAAMPLPAKVMPLAAAFVIVCRVGASAVFAARVMESVRSPSAVSVLRSARRVCALS